jgi:hypothetical protein
MSVLVTSGASPIDAGVKTDLAAAVAMFAWAKRRIPQNAEISL